MNELIPDLERAVAAAVDGDVEEALAQTRLLQDGTVLAGVVAAFQRAGAHAAAVAALDQRHESMAGVFALDYAQAFNTLMCRDVEGAAVLHAALGEPTDDAQRDAAQRLGGMLARADSLKGTRHLGERSLRGWHMVMTGGLLLRVASRTDGGGAFNRRFGRHEDGTSVALEAVRKVVYLMGILDRPVEEICFYPDWGSAVLAHAAGKVFGKMPRSLSFPWNGVGLMIVYDLGRLSFGQQRQLVQRKPGQVLWNHASTYTREHLVAGDLTTFLCTENVNAWSPDVHPASASPFDLSDDVSAATLYDDALTDVPRLINLCRTVASGAPQDGPSFMLGEGDRERQYACSPVPRG